MRGSRRAAANEVQYVPVAKSVAIEYEKQHVVKNKAMPHFAKTIHTAYSTSYRSS
jgi:hypothetical protein